MITTTSPPSRLRHRRIGGAFPLLLAALFSMATVVSQDARSADPAEDEEVVMEANVVQELAIALAALQQERDMLAAKFEQLTASYQLLERQQAELEARHQALQASNARLSSSHALLEENYAAVNEAHAQSTHDAAQLRLSMQSQRTAVRNVGKRLARRAATGAARMLASAAGEATPGVGIGFIVGNVAWEVHEACQTVHDVNALQQAIDEPGIDPAPVCGLTVPTTAQVTQQVATNWDEAYQSARAAIVGTGVSVPYMPAIPVVPPTPTWTDLKVYVCPVIGRIPGIC